MREDQRVEVSLRQAADWHA